MASFGQGGGTFTGTSSINTIFGNGSGGSGSGTKSGKPKTISPTTDPTFAKYLDTLMTALGGVGKPPDLTQLLQTGANSPYMKEVIGPALDYARTQEKLQQQDLLDQFRGAGMLGSGPMAKSLNDLYNQQQHAESGLIGALMQGLLGTFVQGSQNQYAQNFLPVNSLLSVLNAVQPHYYTPQLLQTGGMSGPQRTSGSFASQGNPELGFGQGAMPGYTRTAVDPYAGYGVDSYSSPMNWVDVPSYQNGQYSILNPQQPFDFVDDSGDYTNFSIF